MRMGSIVIAIMDGQEEKEYRFLKIYIDFGNGGSLPKPITSLKLLYYGY
jgi:hypothetical protein